MRPWPNRISILRRDTRDLILFHVCVHRRKAIWGHSKRQPSTSQKESSYHKHNQSDPWSWTSRPPELWKYKFLLFKWPGVWYLVLAAQVDEYSFPTQLGIWCWRQCKAGRSLEREPIYLGLVTENGSWFTGMQVASLRMSYGKRSQSCFLHIHPHSWSPIKGEGWKSLAHDTSPHLTSSYLSLPFNQIAWISTSKFLG